MIAYYIPIDSDTLAALERGDRDLEDYLSLALDNEDLCFDIDKAWAAIHFLLCGSPEEGEGPYHDAILGGRPLGEEDFGSGPARVLDPGQVQAAAAALGEVDFQSKLEDYRLHVLGQASIYPGYDDDEGFNYVEFNFQRLRDFLARVAKDGAYLILCIA